MYQLPSRKKSKGKPIKLNLIPILDTVFIFIFFLLISADFYKLHEISSDIPIISDSKPKKEDKKPLALTITITKSGFQIHTGIPSRLIKTVGKTAQGDYDYETLKSYLISLKKRNLNEDTVILEPITNLNYEELVKVMDTVRMLRSTDEAIYKKSPKGVTIRLKHLFNNVVFGNLLS